MILEQRIKFLRYKADGTKAITYDKDKVQTSPRRAMEETVTDMVDAENKLNQLAASYQEAILLRTAQIMTMDKPEHAEVLLLRYVEDHDGRQLTLGEIAEQMHKSFDRVAHLHGEALKAFEERYLRG